MGKYDSIKSGINTCLDWTAAELQIGRPCHQNNIRQKSVHVGIFGGSRHVRLD